MSQPIDPSAPYQPPPSATGANYDYRHERPDDGKALAGLVVSVVGLVICPMLLIGVPLSALALRRPPRRLAAVGLSVGLIGLTIWGVYFWCYADEIRTTASRFTGSYLGMAEDAKTDNALRDAADRVDRYFDENGSLPDKKQAASLLSDLKDAWGRPLQYTPLDPQTGNSKGQSKDQSKDQSQDESKDKSKNEPKDESTTGSNAASTDEERIDDETARRSFEVRSAGPDGKFNSEDDVAHQPGWRFSGGIPIAAPKGPAKKPPANTPQKPLKQKRSRQKPSAQPQPLKPPLLP